MSASHQISLFVVLLGVLMTCAQTVMKRVVGDNATLPCHHHFWVGDHPTLDIEWLLLKPTNRQRVVITYFSGRVFDPNEGERGRVAFAGEYLKGDASLLISDLSLTDSGEYSCKVKTGPRYHWSTISLTVLDVKGIGVVAGVVVGVSFAILLILLIIWLVFCKKDMKKNEEEETPNEIREDAEAPKAKLVKPNSLSSSRSGSSHSGTSSTQSMVHNMGPKGQRAFVPAVAALNENCQAFPQSPPECHQTIPKIPEHLLHPLPCLPLTPNPAPVQSSAQGT